jgi:glutaredoxin
MVKDYLKGKGIEFNDYNVAEDQVKAQEMVEKSGQMGVPVVEIDNNVIVGFDKPEIDRLLNL